MLVSPRMWPDTTDTAPNSPITRALHRITPLMTPHLMFGSVTRKNVCSPWRPARAPPPPPRARGLDHRNDLARDERHRHEDRRQDDAGHREDDPDVMLDQPRAEQAPPAEQQDEDQPGDHRRHGKRQVDQRRQEVLAAEIEPRDRPRGADPEDGLDGTATAAVSSVSRSAESVSGSRIAAT